MINRLFGRYLPGYTLNFNNNCLHFSRGDYCGYINFDEDMLYYTYKDKSYVVEYKEVGITKYANTINTMELILKSNVVAEDIRDEDILDEDI